MLGSRNIILASHRVVGVDPSRSVASVLEKVVSGWRVCVSCGLAFDRLCNLRTEVRGVAIRPMLKRLSRLSLRAFIVVSPEREGPSAHQCLRYGF